MADVSYKLLTYKSNRGLRAGILVGGRVYDAAEVSVNFDYTTVLGVLEDWSNAERILATAAAEVDSVGGDAISQVHLMAPILYPGQIFAAGANYCDHIQEMSGAGQGSSRPSAGRPWFFSKCSRSAVIGHEAIMPLPLHSKQVDWEIELAVVIGKTCTTVPAARALDYVAGYTIANDLSARDFISRTDAETGSPFRFDWTSHKSFDGACPMGPWITPASDIKDPQSLRMRLWVDEVEMQNSSTRYMIYPVAEQIAELSARFTLHPGDVILTGTPAGVGMGRKQFLQPKQHVRLWIERIGKLHHRFS